MGAHVKKIRWPRARVSERAWRSAIERDADELYARHAPAWGHDADRRRRASRR